MSPDYPNSGKFYNWNETQNRYESADPGATDLSKVPTMNRAERRREERAAGRFKKSKGRPW